MVLARVAVLLVGTTLFAAPQEDKSSGEADGIGVAISVPTGRPLLIERSVKIDGELLFEGGGAKIKQALQILERSARHHLEHYDPKSDWLDEDE